MTVDTVISSDVHVVTQLGDEVLERNCTGTVCVEPDGSRSTISPEDLNVGFEKNGVVNGPATRKASGVYQGISADLTAYAYWMGDSAFMAIDAIGSHQTTGNFDYQQGMVIGKSTGSRPLGDATYTGKAVAISTGDTFDDRGDVYYGDFSLTYDFASRSMEMDLVFDDWEDPVVEFAPTNVAADGTFSRTTFDGEGKLRGAFFGENHSEVAGTFDLPQDEIVGAFGGKKDQ